MMAATQPTVREDGDGPETPFMERVLGWLQARIYNDREVDAGLLMIAMGCWIGFFTRSAGAHSWNEIFTVLPSTAWAFLLVVVGVARVVCAKVDSGGPKLAFVALISSFLFAFLGFLVVLVEWRMPTVTILFWLAYQGVKSHLRLMLNLRRRKG